MGELGRDSMLQEIKDVLAASREKAAQQVNTELLGAYWQIGHIIVEHE